MRKYINKILSDLKSNFFIVEDRETTKVISRADLDFLRAEWRKDRRVIPERRSRPPEKDRRRSVHNS